MTFKLPPNVLEEVNSLLCINGGRSGSETIPGFSIDIIRKALTMAYMEGLVNGHDGIYDTHVMTENEKLIADFQANPPDTTY